MVCYDNNDFRNMLIPKQVIITKERKVNITQPIITQERKVNTTVEEKIRKLGEEFKPTVYKSDDYIWGKDPNRYSYLNQNLNEAMQYWESWCKENGKINCYNFMIKTGYYNLEIIEIEHLPFDCIYISGIIGKEGSPMSEFEIELKHKKSIYKVTK